MARLVLHRDETSNRVTVRLEGTFDGPAARQLSALLDELKSGDVVVDFSQVREFLDLAVALLSRAIAERKIQLRGLRTHQERLCRYFGLVPSAADPRAYYTPEEANAA